MILSLLNLLTVLRTCDMIIANNALLCCNDPAHKAGAPGSAQAATSIFSHFIILSFALSGFLNGFYRFAIRRIVLNGGKRYNIAGRVVHLEWTHHWLAWD